MQIITIRFPSGLISIAPYIFLGYLCIIPVSWFLTGVNWVTLTQLIAVLPLFVLIYYVLKGPRICVDIDHDSIAIKYWPISILGNKEFSSQTIKLVYYEPQKIKFVPYRVKWNLVIRNPFFPPDYWADLEAFFFFTTYKVCATTSNFQDIELISDLKSKKDALTIVHEINQFFSTRNQFIR